MEMMNRIKNRSKKVENKSQDGLRTTVKKRLFQEVFKSINSKWKRWVVMVVDEDALRIVSNVIGMYDLMEHRVTLVDSLEKKRAPFLDMAVVYFVAPTESSIDAIIKDWQNAPLPRSKAESNNNNNEAVEQKKPQQLYADAVFLYFLDRVPNDLFAKIKQCKPLVTRIRTLSELNIDFLAKEERTFHLDMKPSHILRNLYRQFGSSDVQEKITNKLVTVCATMNEFPHVRFMEESPLSQAIARGFHAKMQEFIGNSPNWWYYGDGKHNARDRSTLLVLDRQFDPLSPFMHEFTYQAMANDLLKIKDDKITYKADAMNPSSSNTTNAAPDQTEASSPKKSNKTEKEVLLNDNDALWMELRGKHIADVIQNLSTRIRDVVNSNSGAVYTKDSGKNLSIEQMASALKSLPEYREIMSKISQHMYISHQCMDLFNKQKLLDLSDLEQTLATGQDEDGRRPKLSELMEQVKATLPDLNTISKLRLLGILMVSQKQNLPPEDLEELFELSGMKKEQIQVLRNLSHLGVTIQGPDPTTTSEKFGNMIL